MQFGVLYSKLVIHDSQGVYQKYVLFSLYIEQIKISSSETSDI